MTAKRNPSPRHMTDKDIDALVWPIFSDIDALVRFARSGDGIRVTVDNKDFTEEFIAGCATRVKSHIRQRESAFFAALEALRQPSRRKNAA